MTTDPRTWSLTECRDWLARDDGWDRKYIQAADSKCWTNGDFWQCNHPIPATLDAIAGACPEGALHCNDHWWFWFHPLSSVAKPGVKVGRTGDEKLDRARLAVLARMAQKEKQ